MKEIGETFKEAREKIGLSIDEVCNDLEVTSAQIENLEAGNINAFKDVFFLKDLISNYAKYLNLDQEGIVEEYNTYMFDYTSKIPLDEILSKTKEIELKEKDEKKVVSPYTKKNPEYKKGRWILVGVISIIAVLVLSIVVVSIFNGKADERNRISFVN